MIHYFVGCIIRSKRVLGLKTELFVFHRSA